MPESVHDGFFLLSRASRNPVLPGSGIIVHPFLDADLILDMTDIKTGNLKTILLHDVVLNLRICRRPGSSLNLRDIQINVDISVDFFPT